MRRRCGGNQELITRRGGCLENRNSTRAGFLKRHGAQYGRLMAARGDLYVEVLRPHMIIDAVKTVISSRSEGHCREPYFHSLAWQPVPVSADIGDVTFLLEIGIPHVHAWRSSLLETGFCDRSVQAFSWKLSRTPASSVCGYIMRLLRLHRSTQLLAI